MLGQVAMEVTSSWLTKKEVFPSFTPLQLDVNHAPWILYYPTRDNTQPAPAWKYSVPFPRAEALRSFPVGTLIEKPDEGVVIQGHVYDHSGRSWKVHYEENDEEELSLWEMERFVEKRVHNGGTRKI